MSTKIKIYNTKAEAVGEIELADKVFGVKINETLVHQALVTQLANERQVLAHTKDRSEVRGGGKKPWRQKGTGRARAGSSRSPIWIGGGVTFGPLKNRNFSKKINKKMRQKALCMVLSDRTATNNMTVLENIDLTEYKTKAFNEILKNIENKILPKAEDKKIIKRSILLINDHKDDKVKYSARNLTGIKLINLNNINIVDLLKYKNLVITEEVAKKLQK